MSKTPAVSARDPDLYRNWLRQVHPRPPGGEQGQAEQQAQALMDYVTGDWLTRQKHQDRAQIEYFRDLDSRAEHLPSSHLPFFWDNVSHLLDGWFATGAFRRARHAERDHGLPVDADYLIDNALRLAKTSGLRGPEQAMHLRWLQHALPPSRAWTETTRFVEASAAHIHLEPPEDLPELVRTAAEAAGACPEEEARLLGEVLKGEGAWRATEQLLQNIARTFARIQPDDSVRRSLLTLFTRTQTKTTGKGLLQLLDNSGALEAMLSGRVVPEGGCGGWLSSFVDHYAHYWTPKLSLKGQPMPAELYKLLPRLAERIKEEGRPVRIRCERGAKPLVDARLADTCLQLGIALQDPGPGTFLMVPPRRKDAYAHLRADPVLGPRLRRVVFRPGAGGLLV